MARAGAVALRTWVLLLGAMSACAAPGSASPGAASGAQARQSVDDLGEPAPERAATAGSVRAPAEAETSRPSRALDEPPSPLEAELAQADAAFAEDRLDAASEHYERARRHAPAHPAPQVGLIRVRWAKLALPTAYAEAPHHPELERLVAALDAILAEHADHAPALLEKGRLLLVLGDAPGAFSSLTRAVAVNGSDPETQSALAVAYLATGEAQLALEHFELSAKLAPNEPERLTNLGTAYMLRGRISEAIATYQRALALRPDDPRTHGDLGAAHLADNRADRALPYLLRATALAPERATFLTNLGYAYQRQGQLDKAIETQRRALSMDPKLGSAWINLGNALAEQKKYEQAEVALRQAETLDPSDPRPKASLKDLAELRARQPGRQSR